MGARDPSGKTFPADTPDRAVSSGTAGPAEETCAGCGLPLTRRGAQGECLRCALGLAFGGDEDGEATSGLDGAGEPVPASATCLRYGHFEVALSPDGLPAELGGGAMGTTYRATDTVLHSPVALKVIGHNVARDPAARARFLREARAAARLHHPNVASVTFYGEEGGECYYAMELVEGETLEERVRRLGPLGPEQTLEVGVQVARALAAAEVHGVVHRDLKPSNLMLVGAPAPDPSGGQTRPLHVKVIDWGLAKAVSADDTLLGADHTRDGFVGTPAFASPEQFATRTTTAAAPAGTPGRRVDGRSDIYSLGVTLWYLLCGRAPFVGDTLEAIHARQKTVPLEQLKTANVPGCLVQVLRFMISFDPATRPQSARELLDVLRRCQERSSRAQFWTSRPTKIRCSAVALLLLTLAVGAAVWRWQQTEGVPTAALVERPRLAVLPFENLSPDPANAFFTSGVQEGVSGALARTAALHVISTEGARVAVPSHPGDLTRVGRELGVSYLLEGRVRREDDQLEVSVDLIDLHGPRTLWSQRYLRHPREVFSTQGEIALAVAARLGAALTTEEKAAAGRPPTNDLIAYEAYLRVHERGPVPLNQAQLREYLSQVKVPALETAVARDPQFAAAYCDLADAYDQLAIWELVDRQVEAASEHRARAEGALGSARRVRPDSGEVHLAQARHLNDFTRDYEQALLELDLARRKLPNSAPLESTTAQVVRMQGRWDEALHCFERAVVLEPNNNGRRWELAAFYRDLRRCDDAEREFVRIISTLPSGESLAIRAGSAFAKLEHSATLTSLRELLATAKPTDTSYEDVTTRYGLLYATFSHDPAAIAEGLTRTSKTWMTFGLDSYPTAWFQALAARMAHDDAAAAEAFKIARREVELAVQGDAKNSRALGLLAMIDAGLGRKEEAERAALHACELAPVQIAARDAPHAACKLAVVYAWTNQPDLACATLAPWIERPAGDGWPRQPTYGDLQLNPVWDPLRGNPQFEALVAQLAPKAMLAAAHEPDPKR